MSTKDEHDGFTRGYTCSGHEEGYAGLGDHSDDIGV